MEAHEENGNDEKKKTKRKLTALCVLGNASQRHVIAINYLKECKETWITEVEIFRNEFAWILKTKQHGRRRRSSLQSQAPPSSQCESTKGANEIEFNKQKKKE